VEFTQSQQRDRKKDGLVALLAGQLMFPTLHRVREVYISPSGPVNSGLAPVGLLRRLPLLLAEQSTLFSKNPRRPGQLFSQLSIVKI
jgi:hypothetical protein